MKIKLLFGILAMGVMIGAIGCGEGQKTYSVDPTVVTDNFQNAPADVQSNIDEAVSQLKQNDFAGAAKSLTKVANAVELTQKQKKALLKIMTQMQNVMATEPDKSTQEAHDALRKFGGAIDPALATDGSYGERKPPQQ